MPRIYPSDVTIGEVVGQMDFLRQAASRCTGNAAARLRTHFRVFALLGQVVNRQVEDFYLEYDTARRMVQEQTQQAREAFDPDRFDGAWEHAASWVADPQARASDPSRWSPDKELLAALEGD